MNEVTKYQLIQTDPPEAQLLDTYFLMDSWSPRQALCLIVGIDPGSEIYWPETPYGEPVVNGFWLYRESRYICLTTDDGMLVENPSIANDMLEEATQKLRHIKRLWDSRVEKISSAPPMVFLDWACTKQIVPPWLPWAVSKGYVASPIIKNNPVGKNAASWQAQEEAMLQVIAGLLAVKSVRLDFYKSRTEGLQGLKAQFDSLGLSISQVTISKYIKDSLQYLSEEARSKLNIKY